MQSHIIYFTSAFVAVGGFEREEIIAKPHDLVGHPDMPAEPT